MKNKIILLITLIACFWIPARVYSVEKTGPKIEIVTRDIDIGEAEKGKLLDFKIEVRNASQEDLIIEDVFSSCGCSQSHQIETAWSILCIVLGQLGLSQD